MLVIGSQAAKWRYSDFREVGRDADLICTIEELEQWASTVRDLISLAPINADSFVAQFKGGQILEFSIAWPGTTNEKLLQLYGQCSLYGNAVAPPEVLLMLKLSHKYKKDSPHFLKTMRDIQFFKSKGVKLTKQLKAILKQRKKETYTYAHPKLQQGKDSFFNKDDGLYVYEHDDIHKAVAVKDRPAYTLFSADGAEVMVDKEKWKTLTSEDQLLAGLEESYVLALERSIIPHPGVLTRKQAFDKALEKVCTSITSGWFRKFCWNNYDNIQSLYSDDYVDKFQTALAAGKIREFGNG